MKKKLLTITLIGTLAISSIALAGCSNDEKDDKLDKAKAEITKEIKAIKDSKYLKEEQSKVDELKKKAKEKLKKAKDEKEVNEIKDNLMLEIAKIPTKKAKIKAFKEELENSISKLDDEAKEKAKKIISSLDTSKVKSISDIESLGKEVITKIQKVTNKKVEEVKVTDVENKAKEVTKKEVRKVQKRVTSHHQASSNNHQSVAKKETTHSAKHKEVVKKTVTHTSKPVATKTSSKPKHQKKKVKKLVGYKTVVVKPAWNETKVHHDTKKVAKYTCNGKIFDTYDEGYAYYYSLDGEGTNNDGLYPVQVDVPDNWTETINHKAVTKKEPIYKYVYE